MATKLTTAKRNVLVMLLQSRGSRVQNFQPATIGGLAIDGLITVGRFGIVKLTASGVRIAKSIDEVKWDSLDECLGVG